MANKINQESPRRDVFDINEEDFSEIPILAIRPCPPIVGPDSESAAVEGAMVEKVTNQRNQVIFLMKLSLQKFCTDLHY